MSGRGEGVDVGGVYVGVWGCGCLWGMGGWDWGLGTGG